jgi:divinyl protochlorophyllide a 8-vinyl-reductase
VTDASSGRIGPNVLIQTVATLEYRYGRETSERVLFDATQHRLDTLPSTMVDERAANALMRELAESFGTRVARSIQRESGARTGDYLLANRIPRLARWTLPLLPAEAALRLLLAAIERHTWTFAGSAQVHITPGDPALITIRGCPICAGAHSTEPLCDFYAGTFGRLAQALLGPRGFAEEVACEARGDSACRFVLGSGR